jgi:hypothetical protein
MAQHDGGILGREYLMQFADMYPRLAQIITPEEESELESLLAQVVLYVAIIAERHKAK